MRIITLCQVAVFLALLSACADVETNPSPVTVFENATLIDGVAAEPRPGQSVRIEGQRITAVYPTGDKRVPAHATRIDLSGRTLLPGLINGHVHLTPNPDRDAALELMLFNGVTTVRDLGGNAELLSGLSQVSASRPTFVYSATLFGEGFMIDPRVLRASAGGPPGTAPWMRLVTEESDIASIVSDAKDSGATGLKLYASLDAALIDRIVVEARRQDMKTWVHSVVFPAAPEDVIAAGPDQVIHAKGLAAFEAANIPGTFAEGIRKWTPQRDFAAIDPEAEGYQALFQDMVERSVALEPALIADGDLRMAEQPLLPWQQAQRDWACKATAAAANAGVTITAGTDMFGQPGLLFMELERLTECGLSPMEAIKAATVKNAHAIGQAATRGSIENGMIADLLVVDGNPANDVSDLRNTALVMKDGEIVRNELAADTGGKPAQ